MYDLLPLLEEVSSLLEAELVFHDARKLDNGEWEFDVELVSDSIEELTEQLRLRTSKFKRSANMRKAKMRFGKRRKRSSHMTVAQKNQRKKAALASAKKRSGRRVTQRRVVWR